MRRLALLGYLLLSLILAPPPARAQDATPAPSLDVPAPEECTIAPLALGELQALFALPATPTPAPASPTPVALPTGTPVDAATAEAVTAALRQLIACSNAGDYWRLLATYSDRFVQVFLQAYIDPAQGVTQGLYDDYSTLAPPEPGLRTGLLDIGPIVRLPDGRIAIAAVADVPDDGLPPRQSIFYFVHDRGEWRIDDFAYMPINR